MVGNFDVDVEQQQRVAHLLTPLPPEMRNDTAFMDRLHAFVPGWDFPKLNPNDHFTDHFGLVSDFLSECWSKLRLGNRVSVMQGRVHLGGALSGRDIEGSSQMAHFMDHFSADPGGRVHQRLQRSRATPRQATPSPRAPAGSLLRVVLPLTRPLPVTDHAGTSIGRHSSGASGTLMPWLAPAGAACV